MADLAASLTATEADRLEQAQALVRDFCGWHISPVETDDEYVLPVASPTILLPSTYVTVVAVDYEGTTYVAETDYEATDGGKVTRAYGYWLAGTTVTFTHGYATVPRAVQAVVQAVAQRAVGNPGSLVRQQIGPFAETYSTTGSGQVATLALLDAEKEALRPYRIPGVA